MTFDEIKAAVFDGAVVQVLEIDYFDTYRMIISCDGLSIRAYANDEEYPVCDMFANIERALSRRGVCVFRRDFTDRSLITITIGIGEEC